MNEATTEATKTIFSWVPKKLRPVIAIVFILAILVAAFFFIKRKYVDKDDNSKCDLLVLKGMLLDKINNQKLVNAKVELENSSTLTESYTTPDGSFLLNGVTIPKSQIISLLITFPNGKSFHLKDLDLGNKSKYTVTSNCVIDLQTVYITTSPGGKKESDSEVSNTITTIKNKLGNDNKNVPSPQTFSKPTNGKIKISILPFEYISNDDSHSSLSKGIPESLLNSISVIDKYIFIEGVQRDKVLKEIDFQQGKYVDIKTAVKIGKILGAQQILIGSCQVSNQNLTISSRIVDVESGAIITSSIVQMNGTLNNIIQTENNFAEQVFNKLSHNK